MSLFWKIFLWFLLAISLLVAVSVFVSWSTQGEQISDRWKSFVGNTMIVYSDTAAQIYNSEGSEGVAKFITIIQRAHPNRTVCMEREDEKACSQKMGENTVEVIKRAFASGSVEFLQLRSEENYAAKRFETNRNESFVLVMKMDFPNQPKPFGQDWTTRILRILAILLTAGLVCYALARYLVKPILQLRSTTQQFADGDLQARSSIKRRDEIGKLSHDFDEMAARIESLIVSQKNLARDVSHELRSPLARMNVALELAKSKNPDIALLNRIQTESDRLNEMISNILTISKLESGTAEITKDTFDLNKLLIHTVSDVNFEAEANGKSVVITSSDSCQIFGNERLCSSAIENVLRNAIRYTTDIVEVAMKIEDEFASVKIKDHGPGIPEDELKEIFRPFYRVSQARERKSGGIGLGLAITEHAVSAHNGSVAAQNTENGLEVEIKLPLSGVRQQTI